MEISVERPGEVAQSGHRIDSAPKRSKPIGGSIQIRTCDDSPMDCTSRGRVLFLLELVESNKCPTWGQLAHL
jgi:hypothetical protein